MCVLHLKCSIAKRPNLDLKTLPKQLFGYLQLNILLPALVQNIRLGGKCVTVSYCYFMVKNTFVKGFIV
jgi:hypothetical protein